MSGAISFAHTTRHLLHVLALLVRVAQLTALPRQEKRLPPALVERDQQTRARVAVVERHLGVHHLLAGRDARRYMVSQRRSRATERQSVSGPAPAAYDSGRAAATHTSVYLRSVRRGPWRLFLQQLPLSYAVERSGGPHPSKSISRLTGKTTPLVMML